MTRNDLKLLTATYDRIIAEDIQSILEQSQIFTIIISDNPASSILSAYSGLNPTESMQIMINQTDYPLAIEILADGPYKDLL